MSDRGDKTPPPAPESGYDSVVAAAEPSRPQSPPKPSSVKALDDDDDDEGEVELLQLQLVVKAEKISALRESETKAWLQAAKDRRRAEALEKQYSDQEETISALKAEARVMREQLRGQNTPSPPTNEEAPMEGGLALVTERCEKDKVAPSLPVEVAAEAWDRLGEAMSVRKAYFVARLQGAEEERADHQSQIASLFHHIQALQANQARLEAMIQLQTAFIALCMGALLVLCSDEDLVAVNINTNIPDDEDE